jgi:hypothetical protein
MVSFTLISLRLSYIDTPSPNDNYGSSIDAESSASSSPALITKAKRSLFAILLQRDLIHAHEV